MAEEQENTGTAVEQNAAEDTTQTGQEAQGAEGAQAGETQQQPQEQQPSQQATGAEGANPQWWKPDLFKLKYRGSEVTPKDYQHAVNLMQKGWSYEQAMAAAKREREEFDKTKSQYEQYARLDEAFKTNPAFAEKIRQLYAESHGGQPQQPQGQPQQAQYPPELLSAITELRQWKAQVEESRADAEVKSEIQDLRSKFGDEKWDTVTETGHTFLYDVLVHARDGNFPSLLSAYRDYTYDRKMTDAKMQGASQVSKARQQQARQGVVGTVSQRPATKVQAVDPKNVSYDDLTEMAKREVGALANA